MSSRGSLPASPERHTTSQAEGAGNCCLDLEAFAQVLVGIERLLSPMEAP